MTTRLRRVATIGIIAAALAASASPATAASVADASCNFAFSDSEEYALTNGNQGVAHNFTAEHTGKLTSAAVSNVKPENGSTAGNWLLEITATNGAGAPSAVLDAVTVPNLIANGTFSDVSGSFPVPPPVVAGQRYAVLISRPGSTAGTGSHSYRVGSAGSNVCPGESYFQTTPGGAFSPTGGGDIQFATAVDVPTIGLTGERAAALKKCKKKHSHKKRKKCRRRANRLPV